ncbi:hypothetical protein EJ03DRAFT_80695 [Teratosphaeria nubilosa]|uniref:Uncharacterized protein n=1 Tax=Teratosphaeria nubilosa TaxID=161662 RepID=A0A6G1LB23_9PEZI|nr:hypothetical protein EJ03DRAFT_80695 [Teratosphaeria nubilosa]
MDIAVASCRKLPCKLEMRLRQSCSMARLAGRPDATKAASYAMRCAHKGRHGMLPPTGCFCTPIETPEASSEDGQMSCFGIDSIYATEITVQHVHPNSNKYQRRSRSTKKHGWNSVGDGPNAQPDEIIVYQHKPYNLVPLPAHSAHARRRLADFSHRTVSHFSQSTNTRIKQ